MSIAETLVDEYSRVATHIAKLTKRQWEWPYTLLCPMGDYSTSFSIIFLHSIFLSLLLLIRCILSLSHAVFF